MSKLLKYCVALLTGALYLVSIVGVEVHTCGMTGQSVLGIPYMEISCDTLHQGGCGSSDGDCCHIAGAGKCHTEIYSLTDSADSSSRVDPAASVRLPLQDRLSPHLACLSVLLPHITVEDCVCVSLLKCIFLYRDASGALLAVMRL